jgi:hypothetical protein
MKTSLDTCCTKIYLTTMWSVVAPPIDTATQADIRWRYMKFCLIKREDECYLCTHFSFGLDPNEYTFTPQMVLIEDEEWSLIQYTLGEHRERRLIIYETEADAQRKIDNFEYMCKHGHGEKHEYVIILLADLDVDKATEQGLLS